MKKLLLKFIPNQYKNDVEVLRKARLFVRISFVTSFFSTFYLIPVSVYGMPHLFYAMLFNVVGFLLLPFIFRLDKISYKIMANAYIFIGASGVIYCVFYTGGLVSSVLPWLAVLPIASLMLIDKKSAWIWTTITYLCITTIGILKLYGYEFGNDYNLVDSNNQYVVVLMNTTNLNGLGLLVFLIALVFENTRATALNTLEYQKKLLAEKHTEITDSINYAKTIQSAILPSSSIVKKHLNDSFVLYLPKDVIAGDFYWLREIDDEIIFAAADCTGHGVPGAMVSVVCNNALNQCTSEFSLTSPAKILDKTRSIVVEQFATGQGDVRDGMDISLCAINKTTRILRWSGANNPLWIIRNGQEEIEEIKPDKQPIGKYDLPEPFTEHQISLNIGDTIYIFTDGFQDQFGGEREKKYKVKPFKNFLIANSKLEMKVQKNRLIEEFNRWRGNVEQVDDVCIIGVKI
ncbi:SpoIIE family protein phosphatase [Flavobacteriales bacterium]|nr:SpoIIE family protein phosphatase [Flavobacteriales bacterium]